MEELGYPHYRDRTVHVIIFLSPLVVSTAVYFIFIFSHRAHYTLAIIDEQGRRQENEADPWGRAIPRRLLMLISVKVMEVIIRPLT